MMVAVLLSIPTARSVYPVSLIACLATCYMLISAVVLISPNTMHREFLTAVSHATLAYGSAARHASRTESEIKSHNLSGWPLVTFYEVNKKCPGLI